MLLRSCGAIAVIVVQMGCGRETEVTPLKTPPPAAVSDTGRSGPFVTEINERDLGRGVRKVSFYVEDGLALFEGDIAIKWDDRERAQLMQQASDTGKPAFGVGLNATASRWSKATVPYVVDARVPQTSAIAQAMAIIERDTGIKFVKRASENDYIQFVPGTVNCWSYLGRVGGMQPISLASNCDTGTIIHEIGHALGLHHEQNRNDRDNHITVLWENIDPQYRDQFNKAGPSSNDLGSYDLKSIMHYGSYFFSANQKPSMVTKEGKIIVPNTSTLSQGDIAALKSMYGGLVKPTSAKRQLVENLVASLRLSCTITFDIVDEQSPSPQFQAILHANNDAAKIDFSMELDRERQKTSLRALIPKLLLPSCA